MGGSPAAAGAARIIQNLCVPVSPEAAGDKFGFELLNTGRNWAARMYPVAGSKVPMSVIEEPKVEVMFVNSPNKGNSVLMLLHNFRGSDFDYFVTVLSETKGLQVQPLRLTVAVRESGTKNTVREFKAGCENVNVATPYERVDL